jgi:hypothetical protein
MPTLPGGRSHPTPRAYLAWLLAVVTLASSWVPTAARTVADETAQAPAPRAAEVPASRAPNPLDTRRDLRSDERLGGHTLARHIGRTDAELAARLQREGQIAAASTYVDVETAERVVGATLARSSNRLASWLRQRGPRTNLVLNYTQTNGPPIGRSLRRGARQSVPCYQALVVLRWDDRADRWLVLTSYPEARR